MGRGAADEVRVGLGSDLGGRETQDKEDPVNDIGLARSIGTYEQSVVLG